MRCVVLFFVAIAASAQPTWTLVSSRNSSGPLLALDGGVILWENSGIGIRSANGGVSFSNVTFPGVHQSRLSVNAYDVLPATSESGRRVFVAGKYGAFRSDDDGETWHSMPGVPVPPQEGCVPTARYWDVVAAGPSTVIYGGTAREKTCRENIHFSFVSEDRGETWASQIGGSRLAFNLEHQYSSDLAIAEGHVLYVQRRFGLPDRLHRQNLNTGEQIIGTEFPAPGGLATFAPSAGGLVYVGFQSPSRQEESIGVWRSEDGGQSWEPVNQGLPTLDVTALLALPNGRVLAGVRYAGVYVSADQGETWTRMAAGLNGQTVYSLAANNDAVWAGANGGLYRSESFAVADEEAPQTGRLTVRAWPNPAASSATVNVPASASVRVEAFDALGRRVAVLHDGPTAGSLRLAVDVSAWPAGVYVVRATEAVGVASTTLAVVR